MSNEGAERVQRLVYVLAQENEALKRVDFQAAVALIAEKEAALADLVKPPVQPVAVNALWRRLGELAEENQTLLERSIAVQTKVVRIVARACAPPPAGTRYNGHGGRASPTRATAFALSSRV